jgi:RHS repeat-associated protein
MPKKSYYVASDAMGNATAILDENGNVLERRSYEAFGEMTCMTPDGTPLATSPIVVDVGFQGQQIDELTGMYQMGYRWYSPILGRWASSDPIGLEGGINIMSFVENRPNDFSDPNGLSPQCAPGYRPTRFTYILFKGYWGFETCRVTVEHGSYCPQKGQDETNAMTIREFELRCRKCDDGNFVRPLVQIIHQEYHYYCIPIGKNLAIDTCKVNIEEVYERAKE